VRASERESVRARTKVGVGVERFNVQRRGLITAAGLEFGGTEILDSGYCKLDWQPPRERPPIPRRRLLHILPCTGTRSCRVWHTICTVYRIPATVPVG
jgi:hypothetical protein